jgi:anti-sigma factor RsiW
VSDPVRGVCRDAVAAMSDLMEGALGAAELRGVEAHLADCPRCRELYQSLCALPAAIRDLAHGPEPVGLEARLLAALGLRAGD